MIVNLPTAEALNTTALKLYYRAWHGIVIILHEFDQNYETTADEWLSPDDGQYADERAEYLEGSQEDLHAILSIVQQCNEIALKARIVTVSPYLLLLNNDVGFSANGKDIEFATLRTLDAVDLPKAVNTLTTAMLSPSYMQRYGELRIQRNQYTHLGDTSIVLDPVEMCAMMVDQYRELWPGRPWFRDRVESTHGREGHFDGKHWSSRQEIMYLLDYDRALIPAGAFKTLFGVSKSAIKFGCHECQDDWAVSRNGPGLLEAPTAFYVKTKNAMHCLICDEDFDAVFGICSDDSCGGKFAAADDAPFGAGQCFTCGECREA
jgi:hypothetical protein